MLLVMCYENSLAELLHQLCYKRNWDYIPDTADETAQRKCKSFAFEVEQFGPNLSYIKTFYLEETGKSKRSQDLTLP